MPKRLGLIIGAVLAILAAVLVKLYLDQQRRTIETQAKKAIAQVQAQVQKNQTAVLVAKQDIPKGMLLEATMLEAAVFPNQYVSPQAVTSFERISGTETIAAISKGEQITLSKLMLSREAARISLSMSTPIGKRAVTIPIDTIAGVGGMIRPGDYVDVMCMVPVPVQTPDGKKTTQEINIPVFQNVLILALGQELVSPDTSKQKRKEEKKEPSPFITLALTPQEASLLIFLQEQQAKMRLILRSPADSKIQPFQPANWDTLFQYLSPPEQIGSARKDQPKVEQTKREVEIYRGLEKEVVPLSK